MFDIFGIMTFAMSIFILYYVEKIYKQEFKKKKEDKKNEDEK